ncbi:MAG: cell filamentation protein Fic [Sulfurimonas sp.]|nr:MAG: cell filamentation protein Fic [Sulfurimonas sp.]
MSSEKRWIWEEVEYPNFTYKSEVINPLVQKITLHQGCLIAFTSFLNEENLKERQFEILSDEAINTSAIEGESLNRDSVRASVAKRLGVFNFNTKKVDLKTEGLIDILIDANTNYNQDLTLERIFGWHHALFQNGYSGFSKINVAEFRGSEIMEVVSGAIGKEVIRYQAPNRERLESEVEAFLKWFNAEEESLVKAAIAHLWFVVIHPLDDGNGRISRAITDLVLSKIENSKVSKLYSMSTAINEDRKGYYEALDATTGFKHKKDSLLDITEWIEWFLKTLLTSLEDAKRSLHYVVEKTAFWDKHKESELNARQIKVLNKILDKGVENFEGGLNKRKYVAIAKTSTTSATRDLQELIEKGCIKQKEGTSGRATSYDVVV